MAAKDVTNINDLLMHHTSVVYLKFVEKVQMLVPDSSRMQIPLLSPFFKEGICSGEA
jgi:hypothetical protein